MGSINIKDIARLCGVGVSTVSRAINNHPDINPETKDMIMMSPKVFEAGNFQTFQDVVGTGPYVRAEMISGDCTRFVRNENYWGEAPFYDEIVVKYIPEASSRLQALQTGEVDLIYGADLITYDDYNQAMTLDGISGEINEGSTLTRNLVLNASGPMLFLFLKWNRRKLWQ